MSSRIQNGLDQDFLIISGEWHDDLHYPTRDEQPGGVFVGLSNHFPPIDNEIFYLDLFGFAFFFFLFFFFFFFFNFLMETFLFGINISSLLCLIESSLLL